MRSAAELLLRDEAGDEPVSAIITRRRDDSLPASSARAVATLGRATLLRFIVLYVAKYAAYGVASPFFPAFLGERGLAAEQLGLTLAAAMAVRLISAPLAARAGDASRRLRGVLVVSALAAAIATFGLLRVQGLSPLVALALLQAATIAPTTVLADALALARARPTKDSAGFEYGWVRGAGSAAFVAAMLVAGQAVSRFGLDVTIQLQAALLVATTISACFVPGSVQPAKQAPCASGRGGIVALVRCRPLRSLVLVAALVVGSHAMHDAFAVLRWTFAGIDPGTMSMLWSESVIAEVAVFFVVGPALLARLTPAGAIALAAAAGALRWAVMALPCHVPLLAIVQPLHGLSFALFHLAAMRLIARVVPASLEATALAIYGTVGVGIPTALLTLISGALYASYASGGFWVMSALSAAALPLAWTLRERSLRRASVIG